MATRNRQVRSFRDRPARWEDLDEVPEDWVGEIVGGALVMTPRPGVAHQRASTHLGGLVVGPFGMGVGGPGGWVILVEPYVAFGDEVRAPDLAGWRRERWVEPPGRAPVRVAPDWICEVLSASTQAEDRTAKRELYRRASVRHLWLIDPEARTLEVQRLEREGWLIVGSWADDDHVRAEPFEAIDIDLGLLWGPKAEDEGE
jgi:Uma2 family endonuclease